MSVEQQGGPGAGWEFFWIYFCLEATWRGEKKKRSDCWIRGTSRNWGGGNESEKVLHRRGMFIQP